MQLDVRYKTSPELNSRIRQKQKGGGEATGFKIWDKHLELKIGVQIHSVCVCFVSPSKWHRGTQRLQPTRPSK